MKKTLTLLSALALSVTVSAQTQIQPCYTDQAMKHLFDTDPAAKARFEKAQQEGTFSQEYSAKMSGNNQVNTVYALDTIPVVFHILHQGGAENVSNAAIHAALAEINAVYTKSTWDTASIDPYFQSVYAKTNIVFQLATKDPNGNCTNGIIRHYDAHTDWQQGISSNYAYSGSGTNRWPSNKYLNIYIVRQIIPASGSSTGGTIVGYTYIPGTWSTNSSSDAIVYHYGFLSGGNARSLAHEMGHWLGLSHVFGNTNNPGVTCGDDNLASGTPGSGVTDDTPATYGFFSTCPAQGAANTCDPSNHANAQNIMDYSSCPLNFTEGQSKRMHNVLGLSTSGRNNLTTAANKVATGIRNPQICAPAAEFRVSKRYVCQNSTAQFYDSTLNAPVTGWQWSFPGGTPSTSTDSMPVVTYNTTGVFAVSYTASNATGSNSITKSNYINVISNVASYNGPYSESFESIVVPGSDWTVNNPFGNGWQQVNTAASTGTTSMMIDNFNNSPDDVDELYSPSFDLNSIYSTAPPVSFKFKVAYQQQATTNLDKLQVFSSTNCGQAWTARYTKTGTSLSTAGTGSTPFTPSSTQWRTETVNVVPISNQSNVLFKFVFTSDPSAQGNNIYIDDINITGATTGIEENSIENLLNLQVYPNPSVGGAATISFDLYEKHYTKLYITDMLGKVVENVVSSTELGAGNHKYAVGKNNLNPGIYFMNLNVDGHVFTQKLMVE